MSGICSRLARRDFVRGGLALTAINILTREGLAAEGTRYWGFGASADSLRRQFALDDAVPELFRLYKGDERRGISHRLLQRQYCKNSRFRTAAEVVEWDRNLPTPELEIKVADYTPDFLHTFGIQLASHRLRDVMALGPDTVAWLPVVLRNPSQKAADQDYRQMMVLNFVDLLERERVTDYDRVELTCHNGSKAEWRIAKQSYWRENFTAPYELFNVRDSHHILATDALATRVLKAGITDVEFIDYHRMQEIYDREGKSTIIQKKL